MPDMQGIFMQLVGRNVAEVQEGLVDGVYFHFPVFFRVSCQYPKCIHYSSAQVSIKMVIGGKDRDTVLLYKMSCFEIRTCHAYAQHFGLVAARDDTTVIVAQHYYGPVPEIRPE